MNNMTTTINGTTYQHPDTHRIITATKLAALRATAELLADLDRSPHGRHEGDVESQDPTGVSQGNPHIRTGQTIGYTISGRPIVMPERGDRHDPAAWTDTA